MTHHPSPARVPHLIRKIRWNHLSRNQKPETRNQKPETRNRFSKSLRFEITETHASWSSSEVTFLSECKPINSCECGSGCPLGFKGKHPHLTILAVSNDAIALAGPFEMFHSSNSKLHQM